FSLIITRPTRYTLFPYTTLFRSKFQDLLNQGVKPDTTAFRELYLKEEGSGSNEKLIYRNSILEENYKLSSSIFDIGLDSINIKRSEEHTSELQSRENLVCRLLLE